MRPPRSPALPLLLALLAGCEGEDDSTDDTDAAETDAGVDSDVEPADTDDTDDTDVPVPVCGDGRSTSGMPCFDAGTGHDAGGTVTALVIVDWDGGGADVLFGRGDEVLLLSGTGGGSFGPALEVVDLDPDDALDAAIHDLAAGQLDAGLDVDVVVGSELGNARVLFGDGEGGVAFAEDVTYGEGPALDVHVAQVLGSSATPDILETTAACGSVTLTNGVEGAGFFGTASSLCAFPHPSHGVFADTSPEVTAIVGVAEDELTTSHVLEDDGTFELAAAEPIALPSNGVRVLAADLDADGDDDVAVLDDAGALLLFTSDGEGGWVAVGDDPYLSIALGAPGDDLVAGDLDDDGDVDLAVTLPADDAIAIALQDDAGGFTIELLALAAGASPTRLASRDLNGDGIPDLVVATTLEGEQVTLLLSDP